VLKHHWLYQTLLDPHLKAKYPKNNPEPSVNCDGQQLLSCPENGDS
jgi:hypothetical protein